MHEPVPRQAATLDSLFTTTTMDDSSKELHVDIELRSVVNLTKCGVHIYAAHASTELLCLSFAIGSGPVQRWFPGDPVPGVFFEAANDPDWTAFAHNASFEITIGKQILSLRHGFPVIPHNQYRCTQAAALALALPPKLKLLANVMNFKHRKDEAGERLMHAMTKPRKPKAGEDPNGIYWVEDINGDKIIRLSDYNCTDVEVEREADSRVGRLSDYEQEVWLLSHRINERGFHVDRALAEAALKIAEAAGPEIDDALSDITDGAVTGVNQIKRLKDWLKTRGVETASLDSDTIEELLEDENLKPAVRQALLLRAGGAQAAVKKIGALLARAGADDRIRGAFRYHGASTGRWSGEGYQPQNLKRPEVDDLDAAIAAVSTGDYQLMKQLYPKPLSVVGDCSRAMITAADGHDLLGADLSSIEGVVAAWVAGEEWKLETYRQFNRTGDPRLEPYCITACKIFGVPDGSYDKNSPERKVGKTCELAFQYAGGLRAWRNFSDKFTDEEVETFKHEWRSAHPKIVRYWREIDAAAVKAVHEIGVEVVCGPVTLRSDDAFLTIRLPSGRDLCYPNPRLICDDRDNARVVYDDNASGKFAPCRGGFGAYSGIWFENIVSGISRDILVEAMFRIEAAGFPIVLHVHDECIAEVPTGFGSETEFLKLMTQPPAWAPDLPIAAKAWRGYRYDKSGDSPTATALPPAPVVEAAPKPPSTPAEAPEADDPATLSASFTRFEAQGERLSKHYKQGLDGKVFKLGGTQMSRGTYETITIKAAEPATILAEVGTRIDVFNFREALGLGVVKDGLPPNGTIVTKGQFERCHTNPRSSLRDAIPRALSHFDWSSGLGLLLLDGDERDNLFEALVSLYPPFAEVAALVRPSASASVKDPATGMRLKTGEHVFVLIDDPSKAKACLEAVLRLSWCVGVGHSAGWLGLAKDGDPLVYGPVDVTVGSPERLVYEGAVTLDKGLERLPRLSKVIGGVSVLCAAELITFANQHAPAKQFNELVATKKIDPAFLAQQAAVKAAYRADHIEKGVAKGKPRDEVEREFDRTTRAAGERIGDRIWRELSPHHVLYFPDGTSFLASEMGADPERFHKKECCDPVEGLDYQSRNPGWILHQGGRVEIYSRAHSDRYAYFLPLYTQEGLGELLRDLVDPDDGAAAVLNKEADAAKAAKAQEKEAKAKAKQERKEARLAKIKAKAETETSSPVASEAPEQISAPEASEAPETPPTSPPKWLLVMLGFANKIFGGSKYGPYTNKSTLGETYGPYGGSEGLLNAFLIRCVEEGIPDERIIYSCISERFKDSKGAIHTHCRRHLKGRADLERLIALAKAGDLGNPEDYRGFLDEDDDEDERQTDELEASAVSDHNAALKAKEYQADFDLQTEFNTDAILEAAEAQAKARANDDAQAEFNSSGGGGGGGGDGGGRRGGGGGGGSGPQPGFAGQAKPIIKWGPLSVMADEAGKVLIRAGAALYQRGKSLVRPVTVPVQSFHGTTASASQLVKLSLPYLRDTLCKNSSWVKYDARSRKWKEIHPPADAAQVLLERFGDWDFRVIAGIISTPTMRPDGTILSEPGYDPVTQLLLVAPPPMRDIPDKPTREDALQALGVLKDLIREFPFVDDEGVSLAVALSAIISPVCRGAYPIVPVHIIDAPEAGTGKSYLLSTVSWIATGQAMPALGSDDQKELDKRLDAAVLSGQSLICIDNSVNSIGGETICRLTEQWRAQVRIFGVLELVYVDARGITFYANGNNVIVRGDFSRRVIKSRLDALMARPSSRQFRKPSPMEMILADRGKYIAACLTVCRAYIAAGRPGKLPQLASYGEWSDTVRSALVWLGEADPVKSQDEIHSDDPEKVALMTLLHEWKIKIGVGFGNAKQLRDLINICDANKATPNGKEYTNEALRAAVLGVMPPQHHLKPDAKALGNWLRSRKERRVGKLRFRNKPETGSTPGVWWVEES
jgi:hypothetical protein